MLVIDDSGDRKDGVKTAHVGHQWLGRYGKTDNGVVTVTTVWADERLYYPVHAVPYTPAKHFAKGKSDPGFRTSWRSARPGGQGQGCGFVFRAVAADSAYGDQDGFRSELSEAGLPFVMALKPRRGTWAYGADAHTPVDAARDLAWDGPDIGRLAPGDPGLPRWPRRDLVGGGRDAGLVGTGRRPAAGGGHRDPGTLPGKATWYLVTNLPRPGGPRRPAARTRRRTWRRSCGSTGSGTGSSRVISRSRTSWAGPTSRSAPIPRSAATRPWSTARSASAGPPGSPITRSSMTRHRRPDPAAERGGTEPAGPPPAPSWPRALRAIRAWLFPWIALQRWWPAWSTRPRPRSCKP